MLGVFHYYRTTRKSRPLKASLQHFVLMSQLSSEFTAELKSLMRTAYQGCLGVRVCACVCMCGYKPEANKKQRTYYVTYTSHAFE